MNYEIGKVYKTDSGLIVKLHGVHRGVVHHSENEVKHFTEMTFRVLGGLNEFHIKVPYTEVVSHESAAEKAVVNAIIDAIIDGTAIPHDLPATKS